MEAKKTSFIVACKQYFGFLPGETLQQFKDEVNALTPEDRKELAPLLSEVLGNEVTP